MRSVLALVTEWLAWFCIRQANRLMRWASRAMALSCRVLPPVPVQQEDEDEDAYAAYLRITGQGW